MAEIRWFGHNCFRIKGREATVLTDPVGRGTGYTMAKQTADIVTLSHDHPDHANLAAVKPPFQTVQGPGEYELHDVFITGIRTYHDDQRGELRGYNTIYRIELDGMIICHLGDLGHALTEEQTEALSNIDVALVPAGGGTVVDPVRVAEIVAQLEPKLVIPMQYATTKGDQQLGSLAEFWKQFGVEPSEPEDRLALRSSDLGETMRLVTLAVSS